MSYIDVKRRVDMCRFILVISGDLLFTYFENAGREIVTIKQRIFFRILQLKCILPGVCIRIPCHGLCDRRTCRIIFPLIIRKCYFNGIRAFSAFIMIVVPGLGKWKLYHTVTHFADSVRVRCKSQPGQGSRAELEGYEKCYC